MKFFRALALALFVSACALAQQNAALMPMPKLQFFDGTGTPLAGGLVFTCVAGSTCPGTPLATYTDITATVANTNPVVLDSGGFASIWLGKASYKIVVESSAGVTIWTQDNVSNAIIQTAPQNAYATSYAFGAQTPGGTLTAHSSATVSMSPCPLGVSGADTNHYLELSGGTGTNEPILISGGSCTSGALSGTIMFTPSYSHSGAWTIQSATAGIQEQWNVTSAINLPSGTFSIYAPLTPPTNGTLTGQGEGATNLTFYSNAQALLNLINDRATVRGMSLLQATGATAMSGNYGIFISGPNDSPAHNCNWANIQDVFIGGGFYVGLRSNGTGQLVNVTNLMVANAVGVSVIADSTQGYWSGIVAVNGGANGIEFLGDLPGGGLVFASNLQTYNNLGWGIYAKSTIYIAGGNSFLNNDQQGEFYLQTSAADAGYLSDAFLQYAGQSSTNPSANAPGMYVDTGTGAFTGSNVHLFGNNGNGISLLSPSATISHATILGSGAGGTSGQQYGLYTAGCTSCTISDSRMNNPVVLNGTGITFANDQVSVDSPNAAVNLAAGSNIQLPGSQFYNAGSGGISVMASGTTLNPTFPFSADGYCTYSQLGSQSLGTSCFCTDCAVNTTPPYACAGSGTGARAFRSVNSGSATWKCPF